MNYTKGPWKEIMDGNSPGIRNENGFLCFLVKPSRYPEQEERYIQEIKEMNSNAKLIAAAPEMIEILQQIHNSDPDIYEYHELSDIFLNKIKQLIKKATEIE